MDPDGNKVLFIEEIQSDWAHKGKDVGFKGPEDIAARERYDWIQNRKGEIKEELVKLGETPEGNYGLGEEGQKKMDEATAQMNEWYQRQRLRDGSDVPEVEREILEKIKQKMEGIRENYDPKYAKKQELMEESVLLQKEADDLNADSRWRRGRPEPGPFVTDAHQWTNLALKRMIRWASDEGFDSIAWVTGKQSADRYNVSKYVDNIYWNPETTRLTAIEKGGGGSINALAIDELVPEEKLADYIGKEPANKLLKSQKTDRDEILQKWQDGLITNTEKDFMIESHSLEGADMNIGGEYHQFIYDKVLTEQAKKIGKKHGAKVEEGGIGRKTDLEVIEYGKDYFPDWDNVFVVWDKNLDSPVKVPGTELEGRSKYFPTKREAIKAKEKILNREKTKVWTMRLTDKLKEASREGLPYYMVLPPLVIGGAAAQRTDAQRQQAKTDAQAILNQ